MRPISHFTIFAYYHFVFTYHSLLTQTLGGCVTHTHDSVHMDTHPTDIIVTKRCEDASLTLELSQPISFPLFTYLTLALSLTIPTKVPSWNSSISHILLGNWMLFTIYLLLSYWVLFTQIAQRGLIQSPPSGYRTHPLTLILLYTPNTSIKS